MFFWVPILVIGVSDVAAGERAKLQLCVGAVECSSDTEATHRPRIF